MRFTSKCVFQILYADGLRAVQRIAVDLSHIKAHRAVQVLFRKVKGRCFPQLFLLEGRNILPRQAALQIGARFDLYKAESFPFSSNSASFK